MLLLLLLTMLQSAVLLGGGWADAAMNYACCLLCLLGTMACSASLAGLLRAARRTHSGDEAAASALQSCKQDACALGGRRAAGLGLYRAVAVAVPVLAAIGPLGGTSGSAAGWVQLEPAEKLGQAAGERGRVTSVFSLGTAKPMMIKPHPQQCNQMSTAKKDR